MRMEVVGRRVRQKWGGVGCPLGDGDGVGGRVWNQEMGWGLARTG